MTAPGATEPLLTLEPFVEAIREGVEGARWTLSGLQKTTSQEFEGRWQGQSTRSAYLFFHRDGQPDEVSVDVYLDETSRGLQGNLALVLDGPSLVQLEPVPAMLGELGRVASRHLPAGYRTPVSLRLRLPEPDAPPEDADAEIRFKLRIPGGAVRAGAGAVSALATASVRAFEGILVDPELRWLVDGTPG